MKTVKRWLYSLSLTLGVLMSSCAIEPPLHLPEEAVETLLPLVITELEVVWNVDANWQSHWYYGWDETDILRWGAIEYPEPTSFEVRRFYQGEQPSGTHTLVESFTVIGSHFKRRYSYGYHDLLFWSDIDSPDNTQTVLIDESDIDNIVATTTSSAVAYARSRNVELKKQPDIFYRAYERDFYISRNIEDYDYFDEKENAWVRELKTMLDPVVYIYLVQVLVYNNNGRVAGLADNATLTGMAYGVNLNTGKTLSVNSDITFEMRMKRGLQAEGGRPADIMGCMFTTYGLCGMDPWRVSRGEEYSGSRGDLSNTVLLDILFGNSSDAVFSYDVTPQLHRQPHGGVITIEIDADTISVPRPGTSSSSGFRPTIEDYADSLTYDIGM